jgi:hypothetical protein
MPGPSLPVTFATICLRHRLRFLRVGARLYLSIFSGVCHALFFAIVSVIILKLRFRFSLGSPSVTALTARGDHSFGFAAQGEVTILCQTGRFQVQTSLSCLSYLVGAEDAHVVAALESGRIGYGTLAHTAAHLPDRFVFVLFHPAQQILENGSHVVDPIL